MNIDHLQAFIEFAEHRGMAREHILNELRALASGNNGIYTERARNLLEGYYDSRPY